MVSVVPIRRKIEAPPPPSQVRSLLSAGNCFPKGGGLTSDTDLPRVLGDYSSGG